MSTLYTDNIRANNASQITLPTGQKIVAADMGSIVAPGNIIQVANGASTTDETITSTSITNTSLSGTITPKYANSLIMVQTLVHFHIRANEAGGDLNISRDASGTYTNLTGSGQDFYVRHYTNNSSNYAYFPVTLIGFDTPNTTSSVLYRLRGSATGSTGFGIFGNRGKSRIIMTEIAQ